MFYSSLFPRYISPLHSLNLFRVFKLEKFAWINFREALGLKISRGFIFANRLVWNISRGFNFANFEKTREIRENFYPRKFLPLKYLITVLSFITEILRPRHCNALPRSGVTNVVGLNISVMTSKTSY